MFVNKQIQYMQQTQFTSCKEGKLFYETWQNNIIRETIIIITGKTESREDNVMIFYHKKV